MSVRGRAVVVALLVVSASLFPFVAPVGAEEPDGCGEGDKWARSAEVQTNAFGFLTWENNTVRYGGSDYRGFVVHFDTNDSQAVQTWANDSDRRQLRRLNEARGWAVVSAPGHHAGLGHQLSLVSNTLRTASWTECIGVVQRLQVEKLSSRDLRSEAGWKAPDLPLGASVLGDADPTAEGVAFGDDTNVSTLADVRADLDVDEVAARGGGYRVAVIDSGLHYRNETFGDRVVAGANVIGETETINQSKNATERDYSIVEDGNGHGTHVTTTLAGNGTTANATGIAPNASIVPVKALGDDGSGKTTDIAQGLAYACDPERGDAKIVSMSLGAPTGSSAIQEQIDYCLSEEGSATAVFVATGNSRFVYRYLAAPAQDPDVIAVSASDGRPVNNSEIGYFAQVGPDPETAANVDVSATGMKVTARTYGSPTTLSGTSMATPAAAGIGVLVYQEHPDLRGEPDAFRAHYTRYARPMPEAGETETGAGRASAYAVSETAPRANQSDVVGDTAAGRDAANRAASAGFWESLLGGA